LTGGARRDGRRHRLRGRVGWRSRGRGRLIIVADQLIKLCANGVEAEARNAGDSKLNFAAFSVFV